MAAEPRPHNWWQALVRSVSDQPDQLIVVASAQQPDGDRIILDRAQAETRIRSEDRVCTAVLGHDDVSALQVGQLFSPTTPPLWYAELSTPDAVTLVGFIEAGQAPGAVLDEAALGEVWVDSADQLGAIRWNPLTGEVDQIYVTPGWRRRHIGTALLAAAATLNVARDLPRLWGDGQRTALGETLRNSRSWQARTEDLTHLAPPMTPGSPAGVRP